MKANPETAVWADYFPHRPLHPQFTFTQLIAAFSVGIALENEDVTVWGIRAWRDRGFLRTTLYEIVLQSYLFLGFPRMLSAAATLNQHWPADETSTHNKKERIHEEHYARGLELCSKIYGSSFEKLTTRVEELSPEIAHWMIEEGYGKVLSRPELDPVSREFSIVAFLIADYRPAQIVSHVRGSVHLGATAAEINAVLDYMGDQFSPGVEIARETLARQLTHR